MKGINKCILSLKCHFALKLQITGLLQLNEECSYF